MPPSRSLLFAESRQPLVEHLPPAVPLAPDRIVAEDELDREHTPLAELDVVTSKANEIELRCCLPALQLKMVEVLRVLVEREVGNRIRPSLEPVIDGSELEDLEVDAVEAERVDALDRLLQIQLRPWSVANFVGVVVDVPARRIGPSDLLFAQKDRLPIEPVLFTSFEPFDRQQA